MLWAYILYMYRTRMKTDLVFLRDAVEQAMADQHFVAIGEIGLDFFVRRIMYGGNARDKQTWFYREQLRIASTISNCRCYCTCAVRWIRF